MSEQDVKQFDVTEAYNNQVRPLIDQLANLCQELGVQYEMMFCCRHTHDAQDKCLGYGDEIFLDADGELIPLQMALACAVTSMSDVEAHVTASIIEGSQKLVETIEQRSSGEFTPVASSGLDEKLSGFMMENPRPDLVN